MLDALKAQQNQCKFVFASSIAVYGKPQTELLTDDSLPHPTLSYGAYKVSGEVLVNDYSRRGWIDGRSVRLPGIMSRPEDDAGHASRFLSDIIRYPAEGKPFVCPAAPEATSWFLSRPACIANLIHAAEMPAPSLNAQRQWQLPAQHLSMQAVVDAVAQVYGEHTRALVSWQPDPHIQGVYASYPPLLTPEAERAGFRHDGDAATLVRRALKD